MADANIDLKRTIKELSAKMSELDEAVSFYKDQITVLERQKKAAEKKALETDKRAKIVEKKYSQAKRFQEGRYNQLIKDLFETPQQNLESHIRTESSKSAATTWRVAFVSIAVTIIITLALQTLNVISAGRTERNIRNVEHNIRQVLGELSSTLSGSFQKTVQAKGELSEEIITRIRKHIEDENDIETRNDIRLLYKMTLSDFTAKYYLFSNAMRQAGLPEHLIPTDFSDYRIWDEQLLDQYSRWLQEVRGKRRLKGLRSTKNKESFVSEKDKKFQTYRGKDDRTDYGEWRFVDVEDYSDLVSTINANLEKTKKRVRENTP